MGTYRHYRRALLGILAFCALLRSGWAAPITIELPPSAVDFKPAPGLELAQANCLICHSTDYIRTQPPMPKKFWEAEVKKMQQKYGAPLTDDQIQGLADYLTAGYGAK